MTAELERAEVECQEAAQSLAAERSQGRRRHAGLVEHLVKSLQARDTALGALKRLEQSCAEAGVEYFGVYDVSLESNLFLHQAFILTRLRFFYMGCYG